MNSEALPVGLPLAALTLLTGVCHAESGWSLLPTGFTTRIEALFCIDQSTVFACGRNGLVARTTTGGDAWDVTIIDSSTSFSILLFTESGNGFDCGYSLQTNTAALYMTTDMGVNWNLIKDEGPNTGCTALCFTDSDHGYLGMTVGTNGRILKTTDAGQTWDTSNGMGYVRAIHFASGAVGLAVGQGGLVYKTTNAGGSWVSTFQLPSAPLYDFYSVFFPDSATAFAAGDNGYLYKSTDVGESWAPTFDNSSHSWRFTCLWFTDDATGYVVGDSGVILKTTNAGVRWEAQRSVTAEYLASISFSDQNVGFAAGNNGVVIKTTSGGIVEVERGPRGIPSGYNLEQNYPNPYNSMTRIRLHLAPLSESHRGVTGAGAVRLVVLDLLGHEVQELLHCRKAPGMNEVVFDASALPSGTYFYQLTAGHHVQTKDDGVDEITGFTYTHRSPADCRGLPLVAE